MKILIFLGEKGEGGDKKKIEHLNQIELRRNLGRNLFSD
jgi:hypothetical protein